MQWAASRAASSTAPQPVERRREQSCAHTPARARYNLDSSQCSPGGTLYLGVKRPGGGPTGGKAPQETLQQGCCSASPRRPLLLGMSWQDPHQPCVAGKV